MKKYFFFQQYFVQTQLSGAYHLLRPEEYLMLGILDIGLNAHVAYNHVWEIPIID